MSRSAVFQKLGMSLVAALAVVVPGCATDDPGATEPGPAPAGEASWPHVVSQLTSDEGARITFLNERAPGDDPVISVEITSTAATPVLDGLLAQQPSALELFVAVQPDGAAPDELAREHRLLAEHDAAYRAEPRRLVAASVAGSNVVEPFTCASSFRSWATAFDAWAPSLAHRVTGELAGSSALNVGYAPKFYFDLCRTTNSNFGYLVRTERRSSPTGSWSVYDDGSPLGLNERYRFFRNSFTCSSYQYQLHVEPIGGAYYRGAAWSEPWSCQITL